LLVVLADYLTQHTQPNRCLFIPILLFHLFLVIAPVLLFHFLNVYPAASRDQTPRPWVLLPVLLVPLLYFCCLLIVGLFGNHECLLNSLSEEDSRSSMTWLCDGT
jgi:hypothetical protein